MLVVMAVIGLTVMLPEFHPASPLSFSSPLSTQAHTHNRRHARIRQDLRPPFPHRWPTYLLEWDRRNLGPDANPTPRLRKDGEGAGREARAGGGATHKESGRCGGRGRGEHDK